MVNFQKLKVNTLDALAVSVAIYEQFGKTVKKGESRDALLKHFTGEAPITVTPEQTQTALTMQAAIAHKILMNSLLASVNKETHSSEFAEKINKLLQQEFVISNNFTLIAWAPSVADKITQAENAKENILSMGVGSKHIGTVAKKIELTYNEIYCRYLPNWSTHVHMGHDGDENLFSFFSRNKIPAGSKITARVKMHKKDQRLANSHITILSYVKVSK